MRGNNEPSIVQATPTPYSPPYASQQAGPPQTLGNKPKDDDLISLDVPDPSQKTADGRQQTTESLAASPSEALPPNTSRQVTPPSQPGGQPSQPMVTSPNASRGENWALKGARRNAMGVSRSIKIQVEADRLVLVQQPGLMFAQIIPIGNSIALAVDNMVETINEFTESWETAGENSYWKPTLKVKVVPGGEEIFNDFQLLLRGSGIVVERM